MSFLKKYACRYWKRFFAAIVFLLLEALCDLLQPTIMSKIVDIGVAGNKMDYVLYMGAVMLLVTAVGASAAISRNFLSNHVSQRFGRDLRSDLFRKIQSLSFENIDRLETASLVTRLTNDVTQVQGFVNGMMRIFVKAPMLCAGSLVMATLLNPGMAPVLAVAMPLVAALIIINARIGYPFFRKVQKMLDRINSVMREYLSGVRVVKAFNRFDYEKQRFEKANEELSTVSASAMRIMAVFSPGITLVVNIGIIAVIWLGGIRVDRGGMQVGQIMAFINYMTQILFSLMMISFVFNAFVRAKASAERIGEVMAEQNTMEAADNPEEAPGESSISFENVCFAYAGTSGDPVLRDITFECAQGETIGIIGSTGSGKSSLVSLIPRFYDVCSGSVKFGGIDVRDMDIEKLREKIAVVHQKAVLFTGTIMENIRWGRDDASMQDIEEAARVAQAHDFIAALPEGYNTFLGQGGVNLSGGQKQRVTIARALVRKPRILILDDCTSAVDMATEARIREAVKRYSGNITCLVIAQRITSVMNADRILVLDNGGIVGLGTHEELVASCEVYRDIYHSQIGKEVM